MLRIFNYFFVILEKPKPNPMTYWNQVHLKRIVRMIVIYAVGFGINFYPRLLLIL